MKDSSTWPFKRPVWRHWAVNSFWDFEPIRPMATAEIGRAIRAMSASCQDSQNIITVIPTMVSTA